MQGAGDVDRARDALRKGDNGPALALDPDALDAAGHLLVALAHRVEGRPDREHEAAHRAVELAPDDPEILEAAAALVGWGEGLGERARPRPKAWFADLPVAHAWTARLALRRPEDADAWLRLADLDLRLGRYLDAMRAYERAAGARPGDVELIRRAAEAATGHRDHELALSLVQRGLTLQPDHLELLDRRAALLSVLGPDRAGAPDAASWVMDALRAGGSPDAAVARLLALGAWQTADTVAEAHARPTTRAVVRLCCRDFETAAALVETEDDPTAAFVRGVCAVQAGSPEGAVPLFDAALQALDDAAPGDSALVAADQILCWRSEAMRRMGYPRRARQDASDAMTAALHYNVHAHAARVIATTYDALSPDHVLDPWAVRPVADKLGHLAPDPEALASGRAGDVRHQLLTVLDRLGAHRTHRPYLVEEGSVTALRTPPHPRHEGRKLQMLLRTRPVEEVLEGFQRLADTFPDDPTVHTYLGETLLWVGRRADAVGHFERALALDRTTTWAWIGLGAARLLGGDPRLALSTFAEGIRAVGYEGPTIFVYRAEANRTLGRHTDAVRDADLAIRRKPRRLSAWIVRGLLAAEVGDDARVSLVASGLRSQVPGLWLDAAIALGLPLDDRSHDADVLAWCLDAMEGNRSSTVLTWMTDGHLRFARWQPPPEAREALLSGPSRNARQGPAR